MKTVNLEKERLDLKDVLNLARRESVLLLTPDGKEFYIAEADDFESEVEVLRGSQTFQKFLDQRSSCTQRIPLEEIEKDFEKELVEQEKSG